MATSFTFIDDLIRDYFQYRNLTSTLRIFDNEISKLPIGQYRSDRIIEQLTVYIHQFDINNLIDYWTQIEQRLINESHQQINIFTKIRTNLYRCYLIHCVQTSKMDKINEFFDRLTKFLQQSNEWTKEWFALPFIKNPEENFTFKIYFSKQRNDLFWISLQNFLSIALYHMTPPKICSLEEENSQQYEIRKPSISSSPRADPSMAQFAEILDDTRTSSNASNIEQQRPLNLTIMSKLRSNFSTNIKHNPTTSSHSKLSSFPTAPKFIFAELSQELTTGNQLFLSTDDSKTT